MDIHGINQPTNSIKRLSPNFMAETKRALQADCRYISRDSKDHYDTSNDTSVAVGIVFGVLAVYFCT